MTAFSVLFADIVNRSMLGELPVESFSFNEGINDGGSFSATMPLSTASVIDAPASGGAGSTSIALSSIYSLANLQPGTTAVFVQYGTVVVWSGVLTGDSIDVANETLSVTAAGWFWLFDRVYLEADQSFSSTEQVEIAYDLITYAQGLTGGDLGVTDGTTATGVTRDRTYLAEDQISLGEALANLAAVLRGFDYRIGATVSGGSYSLSYDTTYPATGRLTSYVFELGANMELLNVERDASSLCNVAWVTSDDPAVYALTEEPLSLAYRPRMVAVEAASGVTEQTTVDDRADRLLLRGAEPISRVTLTIAFGSDPEVGDILAGDIVELKGSIGALVLSGLYRITELAVDVPREGDETVTLTAVPYILFE